MVEINQKALAGAYRVFCERRGSGLDTFEAGVRFYLEAMQAKPPAAEYPKTSHEALSTALERHITGTAASLRALESRIHRLETKGDTE